MKLESSLILDKNILMEISHHFDIGWASKDFASGWRGLFAREGRRLIICLTTCLSIC